MAARITNELNLHSMAKQIELWVIDKLIPWARNPRTHSDAYRFRYRFSSASEYCVS
jgi:hypothetical protein